MRAVDKFEYRRAVQVQHVRHMVDPPGDHAGHRGSGADDPHPGAHDRDDEPSCGTSPSGWCRNSVASRRSRRPPKKPRASPIDEAKRVMKISKPSDQPGPPRRRERGQLRRRLHRGRQRWTRPEHGAGNLLLKDKIENGAENADLPRARDHQAPLRPRRRLPPTRSKRSAGSSRSRASASGRSKRRRCGSSNTPSAAASSKASSTCGAR